MNYIIPANASKGKLIFNVFRPFDLILVAICVTITIIMIILIPMDTLPVTILVLSPALVAALLVSPVPNYHNVLNVLVGAISFLLERRNFVWKGWCISDARESKEKN